MIKQIPCVPTNSEHPIPTKPYPGSNWYDLTGEQFSGLTVIGYFGPKTNGGTLWVVQCSCGRYELRRSKKLKQQRPDREYLCAVCELKRHEEYLRNLHGDAA